jgi:hypothetical protein
MKKILIISLTSLCLAFLSGCESEAKAKLCGGCGEVKASDECCAEGKKKCNSCGKNKGSPGCCK